MARILTTPPPTRRQRRLRAERRATLHFNMAERFSRLFEYSQRTGRDDRHERFDRAVREMTAGLESWWAARKLTGP